MWPHHEPAAVPVAPPALLALADGTVFRGTSAGAAGLASGEVVFNTAITGYQEILTDPSYCRQIVTLTHPHIGNTGANREDVESGKVFAAGLVVRDLSVAVSSWRAERGLSDFLVAEKVGAVAGMETRRLQRTPFRSSPTGCFWRPARAILSPATMPYARSAKSSTPGFRPSGSASATSSWGSPLARRPSR